MPSGGGENGPGGGENGPGGGENGPGAATHNIWIRRVIDNLNAADVNAATLDIQKRTNHIWEHTIIILLSLTDAISEGKTEFAQRIKNKLVKNTIDMLKCSIKLSEKPFTIKDVESNIKLVQGQTLKLLKIIIGEEAEKEQEEEERAAAEAKAKAAAAASTEAPI